jgi:nucleotidyltransferase substrate binding protein (TIGR01987 family)
MAAKFYENFGKAFTKLQEFSTLFDGSEIHMAAVIQAFELTFEQCWKSMQKQAGAEGINIASPKKAMEWAMQADWIATADEKSWLTMIEDRNLSSHTYRAAIAKEVCDRTRATYLKLFEGVLQKMQDAK